MQRLFCTLFLISCFSIGSAQTVNPNRCEVTRLEGERKFEEWLQVRRNTSARIASVVYRVPVVVHVVHNGEPIGEGFNFSVDRVKEQIKTLNEDFRRKEGTPGFNTHPDGADARIEFVLAEVDPDGSPTNGITRIDRSKVELPPTPIGDIVAVAAHYNYWNPDRYINIWCMDIGLPPGTLVGSARFPVSSLKGLETIQDPDFDGIYITALNFGHGDTNTFPPYDKGRTLTHEMGHFLGLLHTFGSLDFSRQCDGYTDHCDDTPPLSNFTAGCPSTNPTSCNGTPAMTENYMDYTDDACMSIFTQNQIVRMRTVLENSPRRKSLLTSPVIDREDEVTGIEDELTSVKIYPNPAKDRIYVSVEEDVSGPVEIVGYSLTGKVLFAKTVDVRGGEVEIELGDVEGVIVVRVEGMGVTRKGLVVVE